jgi:hypothetical protein
MPYKTCLVKVPFKTSLVKVPFNTSLVKVPFKTSLLKVPFKMSPKSFFPFRNPDHSAAEPSTQGHAQDRGSHSNGGCHQEVYIRDLSHGRRLVWTGEETASQVWYYFPNCDCRMSLQECGKWLQKAKIPKLLGVILSKDNVYDDIEEINSYEPLTSSCKVHHAKWVTYSVWLWIYQNKMPMEMLIPHQEFVDWYENRFNFFVKFNFRMLFH